jgi:hypothetical protein
MSRPAARGVIVKDFRALSKTTLRGFVTIQFPSGMVIAEISVHVANGRAWASPSGRHMVDGDGVVMRDGAGKTRWQPLITFETKERRELWSAAVVQAVRAAFPEALHGLIREMVS